VTSRGLRLVNIITTAALCVLSGSCGSPTPPPPAPLTLTCPPTASGSSSDGNAVTVTFSPPVSMGGSQPVTITCSPQSGSSFNVGTSTVNCQSQDSRGQSASCAFIVNVQGPPTLTSTRFLSFGDSLTAGVTSPAVGLLIISPPESYPFQLQARITARYRQQTPVILNEGNPGELASGTGVQRFRSVLMQTRPEVVLLMEGTNDLLVGAAGPNAAINALRAMIVEAKGQNVKVALATIPPQRPDGLRNRGVVARAIPEFNDRIRALATAEGATLIDVYNGMKDDLSLIGIDDLHPTPRGYDVMAGVFFDAIKEAYEVKPTLNWSVR
jgi:lysophospholipase L1-like esterase